MDVAKEVLKEELNRMQQAIGAECVSITDLKNEYRKQNEWGMVGSLGEAEKQLEEVRRILGELNR